MLATPVLASAQLTPQDLSVEISPEIPEPGDTITVDIKSFVTDLDRAQITWRLDGVEIAKAVGQTNISFTAGVVGKTHTISIIAVTSDAGTITKSVSFSPATVDLLWEAIDSYVPTLYKGKALNAHDSGVLVQALPYFINSQGQQVNPKSLIYTWKVNNKPQQSKSGFGKDTFSFAGPSLYRASEVSVDVESSDSDFRARRTINLSAQQPNILFYAQNPLLGERLVQPVSGGSIVLEEDEVVVRAEPFFFSDINNRQEVDYEWKVDGRDIVTVGDRDIITLRRPEVGSGKSQISLEIKHIGKLLQFARESFTALFEDRAGDDARQNAGDTNFFGN